MDVVNASQATRTARKVVRLKSESMLMGIRKTTVAVPALTRASDAALKFAATNSVGPPQVHPEARAQTTRGCGGRE